MKVRIESSHRRMDFDITAKGGELEVALRSGRRHGKSRVSCWGKAKDILVHALDAMRTDELLDCRKGETQDEMAESSTDGG